MALQKLDDAEYARRARNRNNKCNVVHRQRLVQSGRVQTNVWLPIELRARLDSEAQTTKNLSTAVEQLLLDGLAYRANLATAPTLPVPADQTPTLPASIPEPEPVATLPLFTSSETTPTSDADNRVDRNQQILALHDQGKTYAAIGRQFNLNESAIRKIVQRVKAKEITG